MGNTTSNIGSPPSLLPQEILVSKQLSNAGLSQDKINQTIDLINSQIMCGPECQKQKQLDDLKLKYEQAQTTLEEAPSKYKTAKRNYFIASEGEANYQSKQKAEFQKEAQAFINSEKKQRNEQTKDINSLINDYEAVIIYSQNMNNLLDIYITKNQRLKREIDTYDTIVKTSERKTFYKTQSLEWFHKFQKLILYFYYISVLVFLIYVMIYHKEFKSYKSWFLLIILTLVPYLIYKSYVENIVGNSIAGVINQKYPKYEFKVVKEKTDE